MSQVPNLGPQGMMSSFGAGMSTQGPFTPPFQQWRSKPTNYVDAFTPGPIDENYNRIASTIAGLKPTTFFQNRTPGDTIPSYLNAKPNQIKSDKEVSHTYFSCGNDVKTGEFAFNLDRQEIKETDDSLAHKFGESVLSRTILHQATIDRANLHLLEKQAERLEEKGLNDRANQPFEPYKLPYTANDIYCWAQPWGFSGREEDGRGGPSFPSKNHELGSEMDGFKTREVPYTIVRQYHWAPDLYVQNICWPRAQSGDRLFVCGYLQKFFPNKMIFQLGNDLNNRDAQAIFSKFSEVGHIGEEEFIYLYQLGFYCGPSTPPTQLFGPDYSQTENADPATGKIVPLCYAGYYFEIAQLIDPVLWFDPVLYQNVTNIADPTRYWREYNFRRETLGQNEQEGRLHINATLARAPVFI